MKFLALNADFSSPSADPLGSRRPAHASDKGVILKCGYFTDTGSFSMKAIADKRRLSAYHNKH